MNRITMLLHVKAMVNNALFSCGIKREDYLHQTLGQLVGLLHGLCLAIDADNGLGVRLAQVYPAVGEVDLHAVDVA